MGKKYLQTDYAYLAGLIDGDGAIMALIEPHSEKKFRFRVRIIIKITLNDRKTIDWLKKHYKMGKVRKNRRAYDWQIYDQQDTLNLLEALFSFLRVKHDRAIIALKILQIKVVTRDDFLKICHLADDLSALNIRSKNRRKNSAKIVEKYFSRND